MPWIKLANPPSANHANQFIQKVRTTQICSVVDTKSHNSKKKGKCTQKEVSTYDREYSSKRTKERIQDNQGWVGKNYKKEKYEAWKKFCTLTPANNPWNGIYRIAAGRRKRTEFTTTFIHLVFCVTTGPKPPLKRFLHVVRSRASSFKWEYLLLSLRSSSSFLRLLPRILVTSISPFIFPSITCFRRQFLRKMWPIQLAFRFFISEFGVPSHKQI